MQYRFDLFSRKHSICLYKRKLKKEKVKIIIFYLKLVKIMKIDCLRKKKRKKK